MVASSIVGTSNTWPNYSQGNISNRQTGDSSLGKDQFMKILVTQLQNQDPMQPLEDKEFIAQMAQFSSVEQIMNMAQEVSLLRQSLGFTSGLIGKNVSWIAAIEGTQDTEIKSGVVEAIGLKDGAQYAKVEGVEVPLDQIIQISNVEDIP